MTNLANANLLDETVSNSNTLKNQRLNRTAQTAVNPNPNPPQQNEQVASQENSNEENNYQQEESYGKTQPNFSSANRSAKKTADNSADEKTILGMKPIVFYGLLAVVVIGGGYFLYSKYGKKGIAKGKSSSIPADASVVASAVSTPDVKITV